MSEILANSLKNFIHSQIEAERLTGVLIGTVTNENDLEVTVDNTQIPLRSAHLIVPEQFKRYTLPIVGGELNSNATILGCLGGGPHNESGISGTLTVDNRLKTGDKVILLSFQQEQKYLIIDRV